jgi:AcrR family transcriptional regulator
VSLFEAPPLAEDRRVRRSRTLLFAAAIKLVTERETTSITVSDLADAADVSRRLIYQQFKDKDSLLLEAGLDFARRARQERRERIGDGPENARARLVAMGAHFAEHRALYRTMLTGSCAYAFSQALCELFASGNRQLIRRRYGDELAPDVEQDLTDYLTGGTAAIVHSWVVSAPDPLDPEILVDRLGRLLPLVLGPGPAQGADQTAGQPVTSSPPRSTGPHETA